MTGTDATNQALNVEDDSVVFDLNGHVYTTTSAVPMQVGTVSNGAGGLTVTDGIVILPFQSDLQIATVSGRSGGLLVTTGGLVIGSPDLFVGLKRFLRTILLSENLRRSPHRLQFSSDQTRVGCIILCCFAAPEICTLRVRFG